MFHARVFVIDGNRFIIPMFCYSDNDPNADRGGISFNAFAWAMATQAELEKEWLTIPEEEGKGMMIPSVRGEVTGRQFEHGGGPATGTFWDNYGDDFLTPELALVELAKADAPWGTPSTGRTWGQIYEPGRY